MTTTEKMITRIPLNTVRVIRDNQAETAVPGKPFAFTEKEVADLTAAGKAMGRDILREPVSEGAADPKVIKAHKKLTEMVAKIADITDEAKKAEAKENVRKYCADNGLEVPTGFEESL